MKFREHRGGLEDSMKTVREFNTEEEFTSFIGDLAARDVSDGSERVAVDIHYYGYDARIDWDSYIVSVPGFGVIGFTNGMPPWYRIN